MVGRISNNEYLQRAKSSFRRPINLMYRTMPTGITILISSLGHGFHGCMVAWPIARFCFFLSRQNRKPKIPKARTPSGTPTPAPTAKLRFVPEFDVPPSLVPVYVWIGVVFTGAGTLLVADATADDNCCNSTSLPGLNANPEPVKSKAESQHPRSGVVYEPQQKRLEKSPGTPQFHRNAEREYLIFKMGSNIID